jgi:hypothetical protein
MVVRRMPPARFGCSTSHWGRYRGRVPGGRARICQIHFLRRTGSGPHRDRPIGHPDQDGRYRFSQIRPGEYWLFAVERPGGAALEQFWDVTRVSPAELQ